MEKSRTSENESLGPKDQASDKASAKAKKSRPALRKLNGEFDPGSGRTLAACLTHASRTEDTKKLANHILSGGRGRNARATNPKHRDNPGKLGLIPDTFLGRHLPKKKGSL